jgi:hypothetical protein
MGLAPHEQGGTSWPHFRTLGNNLTINPHRCYSYRFPHQRLKVLLKNPTVFGRIRNFVLTPYGCFAALVVHVIYARGVPREAARALTRLARSP